MKLQIFNAENSSKTRELKAVVTIVLKTGLFRINGTAVELMGLKNNDRISIAYDEEGDEWYIFKDKDGFNCHSNEKCKDKKALKFGCVSLARTIFDYAEYDKPHGYCLVGNEVVKQGKVEYFPLVTGTLKND